MRKIVAGLFISLDGVVEAPGEWHLPYYNEEMAHEIEARTAASDTLLLGRRTYQEFACYWSNTTADVDLARQMNDTPKLVVSTTLATAEWSHSTVIGGDIEQELTRLKRTPGRNIAVNGSITLVRSLLRAGLLDELRLLVHPVVVGTGRRLFDDTDGQVPLALAGSRTFTTGVVCSTYTPSPPKSATVADTPVPATAGV